MMKILHFSDFHLGVDTGPLDPKTRMPGRVLDYLDMLDSMIEYADSEKVNLVVFAGDAYHKYNPETSYQNAFAERVIRLSQICPVMLLVGNHDVPGSSEKSSAIDIYQTLQVPNVHIGNEYKTTIINGVQVTTFPFPFRQQWLTLSETHKKNAELLWKRKISKKLTELAKDLDPDLPAVFVGHFSVSGSKFSTERNYILGYDAEVQLDDLLYWDYVALGHIHLHQVINENPPVVYAGSLERVDFTEENDKKGFVVVNIDDETVNYEFIEVDARPFKTLRFDFRGDVSRPTNKILAKITDKLKGMIVRIIVDIDDEYASGIRIEDINMAMESVGVFHIRGIIIHRAVNISELRLGNVPVASLTETQLLETYWKSVGKKEPEIASLVKSAKYIMQEVKDGNY